MENSFQSKSLPYLPFARNGARASSRIKEAEPEDMNSKELEKFKEIRGILGTPSFKRSKEQLKALKNFLLTIDFFQQIKQEDSEDAVIECAKYLKYNYFIPQTSPLDRKTENQKFFFILSGTIEVYRIVDESSEIQKKELKKNDFFGKGFNTEIQDFNHAVCLTPTHFAVLDNIDKKRIRDHIISNKYQIVLNFLNSIPILKSLSRKYIEKILALFRVKIFERKEFLFKEKQGCDFVFFIEEGEFLITKNLRVASESPSRISNSPKLKEYKGTQKLAILGRGEIIGYEDSINKTKVRTHNCECLSEKGKVLCISVSDFFSELAKTDEIVEVLKKRADMRQNTRNAISKISSDLIKLRLPSPKPLISPVLSPKSSIKKVLTRSGHSTPNRNLSPTYRIYYK